MRAIIYPETSQKDQWQIHYRSAAVWGPNLQSMMIYSALNVTGPSQENDSLTSILEVVLHAFGKHYINTTKQVLYAFNEGFNVLQNEI